MAAAAFESFGIETSTVPVGASWTPGREHATALCFDRFFDEAQRLVEERVGAEEDARLVATEALARLLDNPLWRMSVRYGLPLEPLVRCALQEVVVDWEAGWRPPVA